MTFLHKLAQRLARLKAALAIGLLATFACEQPIALNDGSGVLASLTVSPKTLTLLTNQTAQFMAVGLTAAGDTSTVAVSWSATGGSIVDTSSSGGKHYVHYKSPTQPGNYQVVARGNGSTLADSASVTVTPLPVASVSVSPASPFTAVGQTVQLTATTYDSTGAVLTGRVVSWTTSNAGVATVNGSGLLTGVAAGAATITATSEGKSGTAVARVGTAITNPGTVTDLAVAGVSDTSVTLSFTEVSDGAGQPASYDVRYAVGTITWVSAASVTRGSCSTPVAGTAFGAKRTCTVLGLVSATGYQFQLVAFRGTLNVNAVFGGFSNVAGGTTTGVPVPVASVTVSPATASILVGQTAQLTATPKDANGNVLTGRTVTWTSSNAGVVTVNGTGLVTAVAAGAAIITAACESATGTASVTATP